MQKYNIYEETSNRITFKKFEKEVLNYEESNPTLSDIIINKNLKILWWLETIIIFTDLFWLIYDAISDKVIFTNYAFPALIVHIILSIILLIISLTKVNLKTNIVVTGLLIYYFVTCALVVFFILSKNHIAIEQAKEATFSVGTLYVLIPIACPLPKARQNIGVVAMLLITFLVPFAFPSRAVYDYLYYFFVFAFAIVILLVAAYSNKVYALNQLKIADLNKQLLLNAYLDELTNTFTRKALVTYWQKIIKEENVKNIGTLILDIDFFKVYNDTYSHTIGDELLHTITSDLMSITNRQNNYVFRYGGEEFMIFFININDNELLEIGKRLNKTIYAANYRREDGVGFDRVTITVGLANIKKEDLREDDYVNAADIQLYIGKNNGRNCVVFKDEIYR